MGFCFESESGQCGVSQETSSEESHYVAINTKSFAKALVLISSRPLARTKLLLSMQKWTLPDGEKRAIWSGSWATVWSMTPTDGGRMTESNNGQSANAPIAIHQHCDGNSNVTHRRASHHRKGESWRYRTEAGIVIIDRQEKEENVSDFN
jgi:hypothetical protein